MADWRLMRVASSAIAFQIHAKTVLMMSVRVIDYCYIMMLYYSLWVGPNQMEPWCYQAVRFHANVRLLCRQLRHVRFPLHHSVQLWLSFHIPITSL